MFSSKEVSKLHSLPSPSMLVALTALFVALGGTGYAATQLNRSPGAVAAKSKKPKPKPSNDTAADAALFASLLRKAAPSLSVGLAGTADKAGVATSAGVAGFADNATNAVHAGTADTATTAATAANSLQLGGVASSSYETFGGTLPSGDTETGVWAVAGGSSTSGYAATSFVFHPALAAVLDGAHVIYVAGTATHCPGLGHADAGYLCLYQQQLVAMTFNSIGYRGFTGISPNGGNVLMNITGSGSYASGQWDVTAP